MKKLWRRRKCCRKKKVSSTSITKEYLERERLKPQLGDFTLGEYTEKVIVYGFLMVSHMELISKVLNDGSVNSICMLDGAALAECLHNGLQVKRWND